MMRHLFILCSLFLSLELLGKDSCQEDRVKKIVDQYSLPKGTLLTINSVSNSEMLSVIFKNKSAQEGNTFLKEHYFSFIDYVYKKVLNICPKNIDRVFFITNEFSYTISSSDIKKVYSSIEDKQKIMNSILMRTSRVNLDY